MYFEQFYLACLSHASYMIGSEGIAAVVDPQRDIGIYLEEASKHGFAIEHVIETHLHADFVSGHRELAALTGAKIYLGTEAGARFPHVPVKDGTKITFGNVKLRFLETPGHTIESISIVVTDLECSPDPYCVLTGDTLFIGDVGRPDLAPNLTPQQLAGMLFDSLHGKLLNLPDSVLVYPAHGAGSLCGRQMSAERSSTIGKERTSNYALRPCDRDTFVQLLTAELPERPAYFALHVEINRAGAPPLTELPPIPALPPGELIERQETSAAILDTRPPQQLGAIQIGLSGQYASWAGIILGLHTDLVIVAEDDERVAESQLRLGRVGIERVVGYLADGIAGWIREGLPVEQVPQISVDELHCMLNEGSQDRQVIDVRRPFEWQVGHVGGAMLKPLNRLTAMLGDVDRTTPAAVYCKGGYRSSIATSLLQRAGFQRVINVIGGFDAWRARQLPCIVCEQEPAAARA
jgi:hydroxyacylglutathione hydrolase